MGLKLVSDSCACSWHSLPSVGLPGSTMILYLLFSYYILFCHISSLSFRGLLSPSNEMEWIQGGDVGRTWEE